MGRDPGQKNLLGGQFLPIDTMERVLNYRYVSCVDQSNQQKVVLRLMTRGEVELCGAALRLQKDVKRAGSLLHKNVGRVFGFGKDDADIFIVEEFVPGLRLSHLLDRRRERTQPFSLKEAFYLTIHLCNALAYAKDTMAHGFLTPSHVILRQDGRAKVVGFGLSSMRPREGLSDLTSIWDRICLEGVFESDAERDIYALGRIFYALLKNDAHSALPFSEQVEEDESLTPGLIRLLLRCAGSGDVERLRGPSDFREELHYVVAEMFKTQAAVARDDGQSQGPPPLPNEAYMAQIVKPAGLEIERNERVLDSSVSMEELRWMYHLSGQELGPVSGAQLVKKLNAGELTAYVPIRDVEDEQFRPLAEVPRFRQIADQWTNEASLREERLAEITARETNERLKRIGRRFVLGFALIVAVSLGGYQGMKMMEPAPKNIALDSLIVYRVPEVAIPTRLEDDADFREKLSQYNQLMAKRAPKKAYGKGMTKALESIVDFSNGMASQGQLEEEMTRRLYSSLSRHRGLLNCLQSALPKGVERRSFNVKVTVLPDGSLTEVRLPGADISVSICARKALEAYRVPSLKGVTVSATLPFTVQR